MSPLFRLSSTSRRDPAVDQWMRENDDELGAIARRWFDFMRACGDDVREALHDRQPTACVSDAAFAYVDAFKAHINVGFFRGAEIPDPAGLLQGTGKLMRHVKVRTDEAHDESAISKLIESAYLDMQSRVQSEG